MLVKFLFLTRYLKTLSETLQYTRLNCLKTILFTAVLTHIACVPLLPGLKAAPFGCMVDIWESLSSNTKGLAVVDLEERTGGRPPYFQ